MPARLIGAHMPVGGGLDKALRRGQEIGCTAVQVFTSNPQQWASKDISDEVAASFEEAKRETGIRALVSHDSYLVNLAAPDDEVRRKSIDALKGELRRCAKLGIPSVVSHMGAHMGQGEEAGLRRVAEGAKEALADTPEEVGLLMETTAGQGSSLDWRFEHLAELISLLKGEERLAVCIDTCHIFAAGYDLRTEEAYERTFREFDRIVGLERVRAIHCNDSKKPLGSRVDRHAHLGQGEIGESAFRLLVQDPRFEEVPILLETPEAETMHAANLAKLWSFAEGTDSTP